MKYLQDYIEKAQSKAYKKYKAFFAFNDKQLNEGLILFNGNLDDYCGLGKGLCCPKVNAKRLICELTEIYNDGIRQDVKENGIEAIIVRELENHEAYYTQDIEDTVEALRYYDITKEMIITMLNNKNHKFN